MKPKLKICGMKHNVAEIASLKPDYLGFIFFEGSQRNYVGPNVKLKKGIKKVGVFVNASIETILNKIYAHDLDVIQLHGDEAVAWTIEFRNTLNRSGLKHIDLWKVFSVGESFNFTELTPYERFVSAFLFDTKGVERGGNGVAFNWDLLQNYSSHIPLILSGGIGPEHVEVLKKVICEERLPMLAIDINSKFETEPGRKNSAALKIFMDELQC